MTETAPDSPEPITFRNRLHRFWTRHRTLFWVLHSVWALATGVAVVVLARERYGLVPWVVGFLVLTWASTLFFGSRTAADAPEVAGPGEDVGGGEEAGGEDGAAPSDAGPGAPGLMEEFTSYMTRIMYQETLFFILPFYAYSTVWGSPNAVFMVLLGVLAFVSCMDLHFDRWLRASPVFGLVFFASVAFAAINLVAPMLWSLPPRTATPVAAAAAVVAAGVLAWRTTRGRGGARLRLALAGAAFLGVTVGFPRLVPPVPLRLESAVFSTGIDRGDLAPADTLGAQVGPSELPDGLVLLARVFAPSSLPTAVVVEWTRDGETVRTTREIELTAHEAGFRVWDALRPDGAALPPGTYRIVMRTASGRVFGVHGIRLTAP